MELNITNLIDKHKGTPGMVVGHGPSLKPYVEKIALLQSQKKLIRIETNNWFDYFDNPPDYWLLANGELNIEDCLKGTGTWQARSYPTDVVNRGDMTILFSDTVDMSSKDYIKEHLKPNYLMYDQRHFQGHTCFEILKNFQVHFKENKNFDFRAYGNNTVMFRPPRIQSGAGFSGGLAGGPTGGGRCCTRRVDGRRTLQEVTQEVSGHTEHYSTGDTAVLHSIAFAIVMGLDPIYVAGMDLNYQLGYANPTVPVPYHNNDWQNFSLNLRNDLRILNESAKAHGVRIINLDINAWYEELQKGTWDE